ncbi:HAD-like domain-containing protein [Immersiella caudata]|uniref:HAD-like domain-containing protein n=1 Tax=Immersiella caudata TaxID=314043 RepID=A0AA39XFT3_9PEZI|nr:HAD-like domain-containing protein [Immersiella caudata]
MAGGLVSVARRFTDLGVRVISSRLVSGGARAVGLAARSAVGSKGVRASVPIFLSRKEDVCLGERRGAYSQKRFQSTAREAPDFAFAFDIDGVLLHESRPIPGASDVLRFLEEQHVPFILLTNGGGKREEDRVSDLSEKLGVPLTTDNFVQSHTPFRQLVDGPDGLRDKTVLVTGSDYGKCRDIAKSYGFNNIITPSDILAAQPNIFPFRHIPSLHPNPQPLPRLPYTGDTSTALSSSLKVDAMFVFDDPRDWAVDTQIIMDLLLSRSGYIGTYSALNNDSSLPNCGWQQDSQPTLYFSNGDMLWAAHYHLPRFGQGAFQAALAGVWRRYTGGHELRRTVIGKPERETYAFAERVLNAYRHERLREIGGHGANGLMAVYMVGDNPDSDIAGANGFRSETGTEWLSILVRTGVWSDKRQGMGMLEGVKKPTTIVKDVREAVEWACGRHGVEWK